ncbi:MAG: hypothetical protein AB1673_12485 [Actinomycetota bacterium]
MGRAGRWTVTVVVLAAVASGCEVKTGSGRDVGHSMGWQKVELPIAAEAQRSVQLVGLLPPSGPFPWLAVGTVTLPQRASTLGIWQSTDAVRWTTRFEGSPGRFVAHGAARQGDRLVVVGEERGGTDTGRAAVWLAEGGGDPVRVRLTPAVEGGSNGSMTGVTGEEGGGGAGFLARGRVDGNVALWRSPDGRQWQRLAGAEQAVNGGEGSSAVAALLSTTDGPLVIGRSGAEAAAWYAEGDQWHRATFAGNPAEGHPATLVRTPDGFLIAGYERTGDRAHPTIWSSTDGRDWLASTSAFDLPIKPTWDTFGIAVRAVAPSGSGWIASGGGPAAEV